MGRPRNPLGDPVRVVAQGDTLRVRYYPTGLITRPGDRKWLEGRWPVTQRTEAEAAAATLREFLLAHRAAHGADNVVGSVPRVTIAEAITAYCEVLADDEDVPEGTATTRKSQLNVYLGHVYGSDQLESILGRGEKIVTAAANATLPNGKPKAVSTRKGALDALSLFGAWMADTYNIPNPLAGEVKTARKTNKDKSAKQRARANVLRPTPFGDSDDGSVDPEDIPGLEDILLFRAAIARREEFGSPRKPAQGRGSRGGAPPLAHRVAAQVAESVTLAAAGGLRECEVLGLHTSRVKASDCLIHVDRQLNRYKRWEVGEDPELSPPKYDIERDTTVLPSYADKLEQLVRYADEHTNGWMFPPTRNQRWWAKSFESMLDRAIEQLDFERECAGLIGPSWPYRFHSLRHFYASTALAPVQAGGLGWSLSLVQECLGHKSPRTTEEIYRHVIAGERHNARQATHSWPGL